MCVCGCVYVCAFKQCENINNRKSMKLFFFSELVYTGLTDENRAFVLPATL